MYRLLLFLAIVGISENFQFKDQPLGSESNLAPNRPNGFRASGFVLPETGSLSGGGFGFSQGLGTQGGTGCQRRSNRKGLRKPRMDTIVTQIAGEIINAEKKIQSFCNSHADHYLRETYGATYYKLTLAVDDFDEESITVKVIHKLLFITAEDCISTYADLRLLPDVVDPANGMWKYSLGELSIHFPYIIRPENMVEKNCGDMISSQVIVVPKCSVNTVIEDDYPVKFGDAKFKSSYKNFFASFNK